MVPKLKGVKNSKEQTIEPYKGQSIPEHLNNSF
jgi:hypothetical protein